MDQLEEGFAKELDLNAEIPKANAIFQLNADCLAQILRYLRLPDVFHVFQADPRFKEAAEIRFVMGKLEHVPSHLFDYPDPEVLGAFLRKVTSFSLSEIYRFKSISGMCTNLRHLQIEGHRQDEILSLDVFSMITQLHTLTFKAIRLRNWDQLLEVPHKNLRRLNVVDPQLESQELCTDESVLEISEKLREMFPSLKVAITGPRLYIPRINVGPWYDVDDLYDAFEEDPNDFLEFDDPEEDPHDFLEFDDPEEDPHDFLEFDEPEEDIREVLEVDEPEDDIYDLFDYEHDPPEDDIYDLFDYEHDPPEDDIYDLIDYDYAD